MLFQTLDPYGYSEYETNQLDNRIKNSNLPQKATISIFTLSGTLVRTLEKDDSSISSIDWDLKMMRYSYC